MHTQIEFKRCALCCRHLSGARAGICCVGVGAPVSRTHTHKPCGVHNGLAAPLAAACSLQPAPARAVTLHCSGVEAWPTLGLLLLLGTQSSGVTCTVATQHIHTWACKHPDTCAAISGIHGLSPAPVHFQSWRLMGPCPNKTMAFDHVSWPPNNSPCTAAPLHQNVQAKTWRGMQGNVCGCGCEVKCLQQLLCQI